MFGASSIELSLKLEAMPGIHFPTSESALLPISQCSWLWATKSVLSLITSPLFLFFKNKNTLVFFFFYIIAVDENGKTLTSLFVLWTVSPKRMQCTVIILPGGGYSILTVLKAWFRKCPIFCRLLRDKNKNCICFSNMFQLDHWEQRKRMIDLWIICQESTAYKSSIVENQNGPIS